MRARLGDAGRATRHRRRTGGKHKQRPPTHDPGRAYPDVSPTGRRDSIHTKIPAHCDSLSLFCSFLKKRTKKLLDDLASA
jgi:hypothetical protein